MKPHSEELEEDAAPASPSTPSAPISLVPRLSTQRPSTPSDAPGMAKTTSGELDPRLQPGAILLLEDNAHARTMMHRLLRRPDLIGRKHEVLPAASVPDMKALLVPPAPGEGRRRNLPRPPLSGIIMDWYLGPSGTAREALDFFDQIYPFTPMLVYSGASDIREMTRECTSRQIVWKQKPVGADALREVIEGLFVPSDAKRLAFRRYVIERAGSNGISEHLLRVCEGRVLDELTKARGVVAHDVSGQSLDQYGLHIKARVGVTLDELRLEYRQHLQGRGAARISGVHPAQPGSIHLGSEPPPRPRPSARRDR